MLIEMKVTGIESLWGESSKGRSAKVTLRAKAEGTIYDHQAFIYLPWELAEGIALGDTFRLYTAKGMGLSSWVDREVAAAAAAVDRVMPAVTQP